MVVFSMSQVFVISSLLFTIVHCLASPVVGENHAVPLFNFSGFHNPSIAFSAAGRAVCIHGNISVIATTTTNENLLFARPANQSDVTNLFVEYVQLNSTLMTLVNGNDSEVSGTYNINAKLCFPLDWSPSTSSKSIQFLIHGIGFAKNYWDFAEGYSYVDAAAVAGYPSFSYDRLGLGASDHPDPIQVVQAPLQVEVAHTLIQLLRSGDLAGQAFTNVIGVGHSFGSIQSVGVTVKYPKDFNALVLTGFSASTGAIPLTFTDFSSAIARENVPSRFHDLPNGYLVTNTAISNQFAFLRAPNFDPRNLALAESSKQTYTLGEIFTLGKVVAPAVNFTGPVDVLIGVNDLVFCQADCTLPVNQAEAVLQILYPAANKTGSRSHMIPGMGHGVNLHFEAPQAFAQMLEFVESNGL